LEWRPGRGFTREIVLGTEEEPIGGHERPYVLYAIILINIAVYAVTSASTGFIKSTVDWIAKLGFVPAKLLVDPSSFYTIFTAMFTHANLFHIFFNLYFLYIFGRAVERTLGHLRFLLLYIVSGIMAALFHTLFIYLQSPADLAVPSVGASGAISGVLGAYMLLYPGTRLVACFFLFFIPVCFELLAAYWILFWFALQVMEGYFALNSSVAFFAHVGGFLTGIAVLPLIVNEERIAKLRIMSQARRLFDIIVFGYPLHRRGLSPGIKVAFTLLSAILLASTAFAYAYTYHVQSYIGSYVIKWSAAGVTGVDSAFVSFTGFHAQPILEATADAPARIVVALLDKYGLFYRPDLRDTRIILTPPLLEPTKVYIPQTFYSGIIVTVIPKRLSLVYSAAGVLVQASLNAAVMLHSIVQLSTSVHLTKYSNPTPLLRAIALLSLIIVAATLYIVLYRDTDYVITPE